MLAPVALLALLGALAVLWITPLLPTEPHVGAREARQVAAGWVGREPAEPARQDEDGWEIDVRRDDGSIVEVTLGPDLELRELDEERGPSGVPAHDEVLGPLRQRAGRAARRATGTGGVRGVEREEDGSLEVDVVVGRTRTLEVELDAGLRVRDVEEEHILDE